MMRYVIIWIPKIPCFLESEGILGFFIDLDGLLYSSTLSMALIMPRW